MKKRLFWPILLLAALLLAACDSNPAGENFVRSIEDWEADVQRESYGQASSIVQLEGPNFADTLGFEVVAYPDDDTLEPERYFSVDNWFCQIEYRAADERLLVLRIAKDDAPWRVRSTYDESHGENEESLELGVPDSEEPIAVHIGENRTGCSMASWRQGGYQYILHSNRQQQRLPVEEVEAMVLGLRCEEKSAEDAASE